MSANNETVLITGGSSGIGYDVARGFLQKGANVLLNGRNPEKLSKAAESLGASGSRCRRPWRHRRPRDGGVHGTGCARALR